MTDTLLIPSATLVADELELDLGPIPTGMIPLHGKPALEHIADHYANSNQCPDVRRVVVCGEQADKIRDWTDRSAYEWTVLTVQDSSSLGETVAGSLAALERRDQQELGALYIQFADTLVEPPCTATDGDEIAFDVVDHPIRWTTFETTADDRIETVSGKFSTISNAQTKTFVGQFKFTEPTALLSSIKRSTDGENREIDPFYSGLLDYLKSRSYTLRQPDKWIDVGHLDTYHRAKMQFLNTRKFNEVRVNEDRNTIIKRSDNEDVLIPEINWYTQIPKDLKPYTPRVFNFQTGPETFIELEHISHPSLSDIHLYGNHGIHIWKNIFAALFDLVDEFREYKKDECSATAREEMYLDKTRNRLAWLREQGSFENFFKDNVWINGRVYPSVQSILDSLADDLGALGVLEPIESCVIHGDFCFSNILFDVRTSSLKLVDPRGEFGPYDVHGDFRYDLAKLIHSVDGHYDFIINDRFSIETVSSDQSIEYTVHTNEIHERQRDLFISMLESRYPKEITKLWAIESLLWLSMVPLHDDDTERQQAMLAQGIEKYNQAIN